MNAMQSFFMVTIICPCTVFHRIELFTKIKNLHKALDNFQIMYYIYENVFHYKYIFSTDISQGNCKYK